MIRILVYLVQLRQMTAYQLFNRICNIMGTTNINLAANLRQAPKEVPAVNENCSF